MDNSVFMSAMFAALSICFAAPAQETGYRDFGDKVDSRPIPPEPFGETPDILNWLPPEEFAEEVRESLSPAISMSSMMKIEERNAPRHIYILPNNALKLWRINISNGSAGNWGTGPAAYLDARTLSFPTP